MAVIHQSSDLPDNPWTLAQLEIAHDRTPGDGLAGLVLSNYDLRGAQLAGADLEDTTLQGANLRGANLSYTFLAGANMQGAALHGVTFEGAIFGNGEVNLNCALLDGADLTATFGLTPASIRQASTDEHTKLPYQLKCEKPCAASIPLSAP
mgnify:CR=1 FL=1